MTGHGRSDLLELPGLIDLQVNGAAGHDLTSSPDRLWDVAAALPAYGVTAFLPTIITSDPATISAALAVLAAGPPADWVGARPLGLHLEGPMISARRKGAHATEWLRTPSLGLVEGWSADAGVSMVTLAPELPGALSVIEALVSRRVVVSVGHTEATAEQLRAAVDAGATAVTHLGNAMLPLSGREPGVVGAAFDGSVVAGVIVDGHHLDPAFVRTAWRLLGPDRFLLVSDTTAALGLPDGATRLGDQDVVVAEGSVRLPDGTLAGSAASLLECLRILIDTTGCPVTDAVETATGTPGRLMGLAPRDDHILLTPELQLVATVIDGRVVHGSR